MAKRPFVRRSKRARPASTAAPERDLLVVQVKTYVPSTVADMLRERRADVPEAAYLRRILYNHLGLDHDGKPNAT